MKQLLRLQKTELYKLFRSPLLLLHLLVPICAAAVFIAYYMISPWEEAMKVSVYLQLLAMAFPALIGIITSIAAEQEIQAGGFQMMLSGSVHRFVPHWAKINVLLFAGLLSSFMAVLGFGIMFRLMGYMGLNMTFYAKAAGLLFLGYLPLYLLQYLVSFVFGKGAGLGLGIVGSLLAALLITGLGDRIWTFLPWGISVRFVSILAADKGTNLLNTQGTGAAFCFLAAASIALLLIMLYWSLKWEGRKNQED